MTGTKRIWGTLDPFFEGGPVMGRTVANVGFLDALLQADPFDEYHFFLPGKRTLGPLRGHLEQTAPGMLEDGRVRLMLREALPGRLADTAYHCFHLSDCIASQPFLSRMRNRLSERIFPVTGPIHSLSYAAYPKAFLQHLWPGATRRDAIVCTSTAGRIAVEGFFGQLRAGFGLSEATHPGPRLERIPLAVDADAYVPGQAEKDGPTRILVFGRISHHSKMDLVPLVRALHRLILDGLDPKSVELVLAGWAERETHVLDTLTHLADNAGVPLSVVLRPDEARKRELFRQADVFVSIADNPQETFGITLVEAGAFGLPVVASDYDGYRDIVTHEETGLLVPTMGLAETPDVDLDAPLNFDNQYHLALAQTTAVDIPALAGALGRLVRDPGLRAAMGAAGRDRVRRLFHWPEVIGQYTALWDALWEEPVEAGPLRDLPHPLAPEYGRIFGHYPARTLDDGVKLSIGRTGEAFYRNRDFPNVYAGLKDAIDLEAVRRLAFFARNPVDSASLIRKVSDVAPHLNVTRIKNHILWALKQDILQITE
ncbi:GDP-mannose-dependent alpha-(1-2)-phosphatidylinositol mannosyltransferase [Pseudodesulfovibrio hydrargyri]|uniref:GDP-mannose-dependent alpha-(1-2)-phosphatidylinositol mannosyltransferase n=1 Tax=Pseudodesulfovibrio hydrargyri TaxID=2125990 RepID=A0A1J5N9T7_9BACT|nr:glycosyltransferase family 4 protein [Pseudodesulfovibrio hydrargyri]OIQ50015.1 GDP-mannose-dependent alpha-(1-2)-phosphatidylinositol mannosyltransferase [Pseudodesulfovibrio hydrargyri]